jgi:SAM-dependent methyltransferase
VDVSLNYDFMVRLAAKYAPPPRHLLDFGCGAGGLVQAALDAGYDAEGVDTYQSGWGAFRADDALRERVHAVTPGAALPFSDGRFDVVISNQVFEHVADMPAALAEIARVLKPGGVMIASMPMSECLMENHLMSPFVHWFKHPSTGGDLALQVIGALGLRKDRDVPLEQWMNHSRAFLQNDVIYRPREAYRDMFAKAFVLKAEEEPAWLRERMARNKFARPLASAPAALDSLLRTVTRRLASAVFVFERSA